MPVSFCLLRRCLFLCETPELLRRLENVTRAHTSSVMRSKWVKHQFWVNCPFNLYYNAISLRIADVKVFFRLRFSHINVGSSSWGMRGKVIGQYFSHHSLHISSLIWSPFLSSVQRCLFSLQQNSAPS